MNCRSQWILILRKNKAYITFIQGCKAEDCKRGNKFAALKNACDFGILSRMDANSRLQMEAIMQP